MEEVKSKPKSKRGFAAMDPKLVSEISRKGGKAAHVAGTAHQFTSEEAKEAGRKGGRAVYAKRKSNSACQRTGCGRPKTWHLGLGGLGICSDDTSAVKLETTHNGGFVEPQPQ
jgi:general stress protein YciG